MTVGRSHCLTGELQGRGEDGTTPHSCPAGPTSSCGRGGPVPRKPGSRMVGKMIPHVGVCVPNQPSLVGRTQGPKSLQQTWFPSHTGPATGQSHPCRPFPLQMPPNRRKRRAYLWALLSQGDQDGAAAVARHPLRFWDGESSLPVLGQDLF